MNEEYIKLAKNLFNQVWDLLDKVDRTEEDNYLMVHMAHTSLYHWIGNGTPKNVYVGEWQVSRVYATIGNFESALFHGMRALKICEENGLKGFDLAYAYEALSRAYLIKENKSQCLIYLELGLNEANTIEESEDKKLVVADLNEIREKCSNL